MAGKVRQSNDGQGIGEQSNDGLSQEQIAVAEFTPPAYLLEPDNAAAFSDAETSNALQGQAALKAFIHDMNNCLMLVGITAEQLEQMASHSFAGPSNEQWPSSTTPTDMKQADIQRTGEILRRNIKQMRDMLCECAATLHLPSMREDAHSFYQLSGTSFMRFLEKQKADWALIAPPDAKITMALAPFQGTILINDSYLARIFQNMVRNACDAFAHHASDGGLSIEVTSQLCQLMTGPALVISFKDNGPGVAPLWRDKIFLPHVSAKKRQDLPVGMGLANARNLAQKMGGSLQLAQEEANMNTQNASGAEFLLTLPLMV